MIIIGFEYILSVNFFLNLNILTLNKLQFLVSLFLILFLSACSFTADRLKRNLSSALSEALQDSAMVIAARRD